MIAELEKMNIEIVMISGDEQINAENVAKTIGIKKVLAKVRPQEKSEAIKKLQSEGRIVAFAGDGINDAPALAQADAGLAMATGSDIAIEAGGLTILNGDIAKIPTAIRLARSTMSTVKQNLFWAFAYNTIAIPVAAGILFPLFGISLNPVFTGIAMALSSVSVVTNSLRLKTKKI
jgi:Cu2+-exporting ATPase/Cu+-exporting ATPase